MHSYWKNKIHCSPNLFNNAIMDYWTNLKLYNDTMGPIINNNKESVVIYKRHGAQVAKFMAY